MLEQENGGVIYKAVSGSQNWKIASVSCQGNVMNTVKSDKFCKMIY